VKVSSSRTRILVSACLLGAPVRYNGTDKKTNHPILQRWIDEGRVVSACPEVLGGLGTPRPPAEIIQVGGARRVRANTGRDVTAEFERGAADALEQAVRHGARVAILKEGSPSCGSTFVYDGTFTSTRVDGEGVTTALLRERGIRVFSENELEAAAEYVDAIDRDSGATRDSA
jgi:uncharacterized protein YbbK (DUF523 family)